MMTPELKTCATFIVKQSAFLLHRYQPHYPVVVRRGTAATVPVGGGKVDEAVWSLLDLADAAVRFAQKVFLRDDAATVERDADQAGSREAPEKEVALEFGQSVGVVKRSARRSTRG